MLKGSITLFAGIALLLLVGGRAHADFYKYVDEDGVAHYTNTAPESGFEWFMSEEVARLKGHASEGVSKYRLIINFPHISFSKMEVR